MKNNEIKIEGARVHNLKNVSLNIPREKLVVLTGLSGSGKSSLAFDTIYAEGQRRYVESLSSYARMFLGQMDKPDVDYIEGLSPAISIDQKTTSKNPRSTVGTVTEIYDYLRLLYARIGIPHCPKCGKEVKKQTVDQITDKILSLPERSRIQILAPVVTAKKGEHKSIFENAKKSGFVRIKVDGEMYDISEPPTLKKTQKHTIEIVIDRLIVKDDISSRLSDSIETAFKLSGDIVTVEIIGGETMRFSQSYACDDCGISLPEPEPRMFSFNNPFGACPHCDGLGVLINIDPDLVVVDKNASLISGAIKCSGWNNYSDPSSIAYMAYEAIADKFGFDLDTPYKDIPEDAKNMILYGSGEEKLQMRYNRAYGNGKYEMPFEGIITNLQRRYDHPTSEYARSDISRYMSETECRHCHGARLNDEILAVTIGGKNIYEFTKMSVRDELEFINSLTFSERELIIANQIIKEIKARLSFLLNVGLDYLTLSRSSGTLS